MVLKRRVAQIGVASAALLLIGASPAFAGVDRTVRTSDDDPGGENSWISSGDNFRVCDVQEDGYRVWGRAWKYSGGSWVILGTEEAANGNGTCTTWDGATLPSGTQIRIRACLRDGPSGTLVFCATRSDAQA